MYILSQNNSLTRPTSLSLKNSNYHHIAKQLSPKILHSSMLLQQSCSGAFTMIVGLWEQLVQRLLFVTPSCVVFRSGPHVCLPPPPPLARHRPLVVVLPFNYFFSTEFRNLAPALRECFWRSCRALLLARLAVMFRARNCPNTTHTGSRTFDCFHNCPLYIQQMFTFGLYVVCNVCCCFYFAGKIVRVVYVHDISLSVSPCDQLSPFSL